MDAVLGLGQGGQGLGAARPLVFYRLLPYSEVTPCRSGLWPARVATWDPAARTLAAPRGLMPRGPLADLRGCPLEMAVRHYPPFIWLQQAAAAAAWQPSGRWREMAAALEQGMHARFNYTPMPVITGLKNVKEKGPLGLLPVNDKKSSQIFHWCLSLDFF